MIQVKAEDVRNVADDIGDIEVRSYSGRGMYGKYCLGVVVVDGLSDLIEFVTTIAREVETCINDDVDHPLENFADRLSSIAVDNMGRSMIYYWPGVELVGADDDE